MSQSHEMPSLEINTLIEHIRKRTVAEMEALPIEVPAIPAIITDGERVYETNLRSILSYLNKKVYKTCKREDPDSCAKVLTWRGKVQQFHDVDEWAFNTLVTLDMPNGVAELAEQCMTAPELRELLNGAPASAPTPNGSEASHLDLGSEIAAGESCAPSEDPPVSTERKGGVFSKLNMNEVVRFHGSNPDSESPTEASSLGQFHFRCASDPIHDRPMTSDSRASLMPPLFSSFAPIEPTTHTRSASAPISISRREARKAAETSFLRITGETLEEYILGMEVDPSRLMNKQCWLLLLKSPEAIADLGRWPTRRQLYMFMYKHGLPWPIRVAGKWDTSPKTEEERAVLKEAALQEFYALTLPGVDFCPSSPVGNIEVESHITDKDESGSACSETTPSEASTTIFAPTTEFASKDSMNEALSLEQQLFKDGYVKEIAEEVDIEEDAINTELFKQENIIEEALEEVAVMQPSPFTDPNGNLRHVFPWQYPQEEPTEVREDIQDDVGEEDSDVDWGDCDLDEEVADVDENIESCASETGDSETQEAVPDTNTQEAILETAFVAVSPPGNPPIISAATVEEEVGVEDSDSSALEAVSSCGTEQPLEEVDEPQQYHSNVVSQAPEATPIPETSPFEDPNGNLHHVFPFLRPDTQENAVADSAVSPVPFLASDEGSAEDSSEAEDSDKAELPDQLEYDTTAHDQSDDNVSESESDADDLRHDSSSVDDATETAATSVARSDGLDEAAIQDQGVKPGDLIAESKAPVEETETVEEKEPLNQDVEEDDSDAASEVSEVSTIVPTKSDDNKPSENKPSDDKRPDNKPSHTPPRWALAPIIAAAAVGAIYVTARCPPLPAMAITFWALTKMHRMKEAQPLPQAKKRISKMRFKLVPID